MDESLVDLQVRYEKYFLGIDRRPPDRERKKIAKDADRLRKYLARFDLEWGELKEHLRRE